MKLICFAAQSNAVERLLLPHIASVGELAVVADLAELRAKAQAGDTLVIATNLPEQPPVDVYAVARDIGMATWALSDHWVKGAALPATADGGEPPGAEAPAAETSSTD